MYYTQFHLYLNEKDISAVFDLESFYQEWTRNNQFKQPWQRQWQTHY